MSLCIHTYSPICVPLNWQSELLENSAERLQLLQGVFADNENILVSFPDWPMGYGSLSHDNLPLLFQPSAVLSIRSLEQLQEVSHAKLYLYDNCLGVLWLTLNTEYTLETIDDLSVSEQINRLSTDHLQPVLEKIYQIPDSPHLIEPRHYRFFDDEKSALCSASPLWVARMLTKSSQRKKQDYLPWLNHIDAESTSLMLGSGNSLLLKETAFDDVHRMMILSQYHSAMMSRIEQILKKSLRAFNSVYYSPAADKKLRANIQLHQQRNDHIEFVTIQFSAAIAGVQGQRRNLLDQFNEAWQVSAQQLRVQKLTALIQLRLDRHLGERIKQQNRGIQTLLASLGALSLIGLMIDINQLAINSEHDETVGLLDLFSIVAVEDTLNLTVLLVVLLTYMFYRYHE